MMLVWRARLAAVLAAADGQVNVADSDRSRDHRRRTATVQQRVRYWMLGKPPRDRRG